MISGFVFIDKNYSESENFWGLNPHMIYVEPFSKLYSKDKSKDKNLSSKHLWCIIWMSDPDEEINKYYRIPFDERLQVCKNFNPDFKIDDKLISECMEKYSFLCMSADERAYKLQKDQLIELSTFLSSQEINMETVKDLIDLKAKMPKIYQDFEKIEKLFIRVKNENRIYGDRKPTARERNLIMPNE